MDTDIYKIPIDPMDLDLPTYSDNLPEGDAFSPPAVQQADADSSELLESSSTVAAPMQRKPRTRRALPVDQATELRNKDLADWNTNYLQNMQTAVRTKAKSRVPNQAKKNAEHFLWGAGIGGIADQMPSGSNPFDMFIGDNLFELITGVSRKKSSGRKHDRDSGIDDETQEDARRVRQKTTEPEEETGRGLDNDGFSLPGDDEEVELPREAASALNDQEMFSAMPWNMSASGRGSSAIPRSARVGTIGSRDQSRRGSRLISASPLFGRGLPGGLEALQHLESEGDYGFGGDDFALPEPSSDYPQPEAAAATQTSVRVREALSAEGENFLTFVHEAIAEKRTRAQADLGDMSDILQMDAAADIDEVSFEELLPPHENTKMVACQGLMMTLALGMKGMLDVQQHEHFGEVALKPTEKAKAMQVVEISSGDEGSAEDGSSEVEELIENDEAREEDGGRGETSEDEGQHFREQFAAGAASLAGDDHDSLYDD